MDGAFVPRFWAGVNIGSTIPGTQPGEVAATRPVYDRWLTGIGKLGANVVRVYTILRPDFYDALRAYNLAHPRAPIYVLHGVWIPEERFTETNDAYDSEVTNGFRAEIADAVAVVHGTADLPLRRGHAGGHFGSDISPWLLSWSLGVEWDPYGVLNTDQLHAGTPPFQGTYISATPEASPMESWLASILDYTAGLEAARGWSRPLTFTNWVTLDPLHHPDEPFVEEDQVSLDATHVRAMPAWPAGFFASYHAYPYYPDLLRIQPDYQVYRRPRDGAVDAYAGYLHALKAYHAAAGQAVMITEFGQPTSLGIAHYGPNGRDQGGHSEQDSAHKNAAMLRDIHDEGFAGGAVFEWIDEWFKFTWNTVKYELPSDRRSLWRNPLTNEEHFGIVAAEPGLKPTITVDGNGAEWAHQRAKTIASSAGPIREVRVTHDVEYVYVKLRLAKASLWQKKAATLGFDARPGGNRGLPGRPGVDPAAEVAVTVGPGPQAHIAQAAWTEPLAFQFGVVKKYVPVDLAQLVPESGAWIAQRQIASFPLRIPSTGEIRPVELVDRGTLPWGTTDTSSPRFDDRHLVAARGRVVEMRIPWSMLTYSDPSSHRVDVPHLDGTVTAMSSRGPLGITAVVGRNILPTTGYAWKDWNTVTWHERPKRGFATLATAFRQLDGR